MNQEADYSVVLALTPLQLSSCGHLPCSLSVGAPLGAQRSSVSAPSCLPLSEHPRFDKTSSSVPSHAVALQLGLSRVVFFITLVLPFFLPPDL